MSTRPVLIGPLAKMLQRPGKRMSKNDEIDREGMTGISDVAATSAFFCRAQRTDGGKISSLSARTIGSWE